MTNVAPRLLLMFVFYATGLSATAGSLTDTPPDIARIISRGELLVGLYKDDVVPFFMRGTDGRLDGLDVALARDIASNLGVRVRFLRDVETYDDLVDLVTQGEADVIISLLSRTLQRALRVRFTRSYAELHQALLINRLLTARLNLKPDPGVALNRAGVRIGTIAGGAYLGFAQDGFPNAQVVSFPDWAKAVEQLLAGEVHALLYDEIAVLEWVQKNPELSLYVKSVILQQRKDHIAMAVHWRDTHWLAWLDLYLETLIDTGALERLKRHYMGEKTWRDLP